MIPNAISDSRNRIWWFCALYLIALIPAMLLRDFTPSNELRYLSIADEALRDGRFFAFTNQGLPYADKPPLYLWWVMLCRVMAGQHCMLLLSLMTLIPACVIFLVMDRWIRPYVSADTRGVAIMMLSTCVMFIGAVMVLRMDMLMCMFIMLALRSFWLWHTDPGHNARQRWLFPLWIFLGVFTKGPLAFLIPLLGSAAYLAVQGELKRFFHYWTWSTWGILIALCAAWFGGVYVDGGSEYLDNLLFHQTVGRAVDAFHHKRPFFYFALSIWYCLAPWSLLLAVVLFKSLRKHLVKRSSLAAYMLVVALTVFVMLSCISSKVDIYILPAIPLIVCGSALLADTFRHDRLARWMVGIIAIIFILALPGFIAVACIGALPFHASPFFYVAAAIMTAGGIVAMTGMFAKRYRHDLFKGIRAITYSLLLGVFVGAWGLPAANPVIGYGAMCRRVAELEAQHPDAEVVAWQIKRAENMDAYLGHDFTIVDKGEPFYPNPDRSYIIMTTPRGAETLDATSKWAEGSKVVVYIEGSGVKAR